MSTRLLAGLAPQVGVRLSPSLRLALELLELPAVELAARLRRETLQNPILQLDEDEEAIAAGASPAAAEPEERPETEAVTLPGSVAPEWWRRIGREDDRPRPATVDRDRWVAPEPVAFVSLGSHLERQLLPVIDPELRRTASYLIGCLDERGRLAVPLAEAADDLRQTRASIDQGLVLLQSLDPPGIGARDLRECLLLQLARRGREGSPPWRLVETAFDLLARGRWVEAARRARVPPGRLPSARAEIRRLHPHPGRLVADGPVRYITPDVSVHRVGDELVVDAGESVRPRLCLSPWSRGLLVEGGRDLEARVFLRHNLSSARRLVRALDRRRRTLVRVMECIVREQGEFFERGSAGLRPMTLQVVADRLGLHESTVARAVRGKYAETPLGLLPLRHFFSAGLGPPGKRWSGRAVCERIRCLVAEEDPARPLSDAALAARLGGAGVVVARRTVTKYRQGMGIERAPRRRTRPAGEASRRDVSAGSSQPSL